MTLTTLIYADQKGSLNHFHFVNPCHPREIICLFLRKPDIAKDFANDVRKRFFQFKHLDIYFNRRPTSSINRDFGPVRRISVIGSKQLSREPRDKAKSQKPTITNNRSLFQMLQHLLKRWRS